MSKVINIGDDFDRWMGKVTISKLNSVDSELELMVMTMAEMKGRADNLLSSPKDLTEDEIITIGALREKMQRFATELTDLRKHFS